MEKPTIRNDDVLQSSMFTPHQRDDIHGRDLFQLFLEADRHFGDYPQTLAVVSEGIEVFPEWTEHIKKNKHRYDIQLHGERHYNYKHLPIEEAVASLKRAKEKIGEAFGTNVTVWYPPYGRRGTPKDMEEICERVGVAPYFQAGKVDAKLWFRSPKKYPHINFHFWNDKQVRTIRDILCQILPFPHL